MDGGVYFVAIMPELIFGGLVELFGWGYRDGGRFGVAVIGADIILFPLSNYPFDGFHGKLLSAYAYGIQGFSVGVRGLYRLDFDGRLVLKTLRFGSFSTHFH